MGGDAQYIGSTMDRQSVEIALAVGVFAFMLVAATIKLFKPRRGSDYSLYSRSAIAKKARKTRKLLEFIAKSDPKFAPDLLAATARSTFLLRQKCWQARDYEPMKPLLMPDLYAEHLGQIQGMIHNHEINMIEGLKVGAVDLVNVRYPNDANACEFTALISATAMDYYVDDRTNERLQKALEMKLFEDQKDTIKLTSLVSNVVDADTQQKIDIVKSRLIRNYGYNDESATDVLQYVASIFARGDTKND